MFFVLRLLSTCIILSDFIITTDDRVELAEPRELGKIDRIFFYCLIFLLWFIVGDALVAAYIGESGHHTGLGDAVFGECLAQA